MIWLNTLTSIITLIWNENKEKPEYWNPHKQIPYRLSVNQKTVKCARSRTCSAQTPPQPKTVPRHQEEYRIRAGTEAPHQRHRNTHSLAPFPAQTRRVCDQPSGQSEEGSVQIWNDVGVWIRVDYTGRDDEKASQQSKLEGGDSLVSEDIEQTVPTIVFDLK